MAPVNSRDLVPWPHYRIIFQPPNRILETNCDNLIIRFLFLAIYTGFHGFWTFAWQPDTTGFLMVYHYWHRLWTGLAGWFSLHQKLAHLHKQHNCRHLTCTVTWLTYGVGKRFHLVRWVVYHSRSGPSLMPLSDWSWYTIQTHTGHRSGSRWLIDLKPVMLIVHTHTNACYSHTH